MRIVVVGGVAGGATAIARLRRLDENAEIILLERGKYVSFANCGLPYYVGGVIAKRESLFVTTPENIAAKYRIDIRTENEVTKIDAAAKTLIVKDLKADSDYTLSYDKLLLSTGSRPLVPPLPGIDAPGVFTLWSVPDVDAVAAHIETAKPRHAVVVGGGFIGLEMAENLVERGIRVTLVEMADQVMASVDSDMAKLVANHLVAKGVRLLLGVGLTAIGSDRKTVSLSSGESLDTDMVLLAIGVRPNSEIARDAGLALTARGGVRVDRLLQTSDPDIYAVGDMIGVKDYVLGSDTMIPLAGPANKQGRAVAANILNLKPEPYDGTMGTGIAQVFDLTVAGVGMNEKALARAGFTYKEDYFVSVIHPMNHAGYYPGALPMTLKLIYGKDRKILGAQIVGYEGVDKRIDTIATAIHFKGTVDDLSQLELAYAPPYSSAKDPVNFAGYTAVNVLDGLSDPVTYAEWQAARDAYTLLDIREDAEIAAYAVPEAVHVPLTELRERIAELDENRHYLVFCAVGLRGYVAERVLKANGFAASNLVGGLRTITDLSSPLNDPVLHQGAPQSTDQDKIVNLADEMADSVRTEVLDVCGLSCPGPIVQVAKAMADLSAGDVLDVTATDPGFARDIANWTQNTGNTLLAQEEDKGRFTAKIRKGGDAQPAAGVRRAAKQDEQTAKEKTMIIFDGDLDKAIASFIIATGAAAMGNKVHMFFTFWGLSILRKQHAPQVKKDVWGKMFGLMLPKGSKKLGLSKLNFAGAGSKMIRSVMKNKGISSLEDLIREAQELGVEMTACQMTMDVMGLTADELLDGVQIGGVATMLNDSDNSNMNLFI